MKYAWASITNSCENLGNFLIEYNVKKLLEENGFGEPEFEFDSFVIQDQQTTERINQLDCLIVPGCTTIALKDYPGIYSIISKLKVKVFNIGASLPTGRDVGDIQKVKLFFQPVAARDPYTDKFLIDNSIQSTFTGCPTLFTGDATKYEIKDGKILFIFGSLKLDQQLGLLKKLNKEYPDQIKVLLQSENQRQFCIKNMVEFEEYSPEKLIKNLKESRLIITGRLHGTLPAIALGIPNFFLQTIEDERFSLLEYLKIEMFKIEDDDVVDKIRGKIQDPSKFVNNTTFDQVKKLRKRILDYLALVKKSI